MNKIINEYDNFVILAPHPDDEVIGCGILINRLIKKKKKVTIVYLTNGISRKEKTDVNLIKGFDSYEMYCKERLKEREKFHKITGVSSLCFDDIYSRELSFHIKDLFKNIKNTFSNNSSTLFLCPPYEGGHPDHDISSCIASKLKDSLDFEVWEYALYNGRDISNIKQSFLDNSKVNISVINPTPEELYLKKKWIGCYKSQYSFIIGHLSFTEEKFRLLPSYDYSVSPVKDKAYYETWQDEINAEHISKICSSFIYKNNN